MERIKNKIEYEKKKPPDLFKFCEGEEFLYRGKIKTLHIEKISGIEKIDFEKKDSKFIAQINENIDREKEPEIIRETMLEWYQDKARKVITEKVKKYFYIIEEYSPYDFDFENIRISIQDNKTVWGSANPGVPSLNFTWHLVMFSDKLIENIVVHELIHYCVPRKKGNMHSKLFYKLWKKIIPDYEERQKELKSKAYIKRF